MRNWRTQEQAPSDTRGARLRVLTPLRGEGVHMRNRRGIWDRLLARSPRRGWRGRHSRRPPRLLVEALEDRLTPATLSATLSGGDLTIADTAGVDNDLAILVSGPNLTISDSHETFASAPPGGTLFNGGRTLQIPLASVTGTLIFDTAGGDDTVIVASLPDLQCGLTINGGTGNDDVTFGGPATFAADKSLSVDVSSSIRLSGAALAVSGTGSVTLTAGCDIVLDSSVKTASITTENGNVTLSANQQATPTPGTFSGIEIIGGQVKTTGTGNISLLGRSGNSGTVIDGVRLSAGAVVSSTASGPTAGTVTITGTAAGSFDNYGVQIIGLGSTVSSVSGDIQITGTSNSVGSRSNGLYVNSGGSVVSTGTGANAANITIMGTSIGGVNNNAGIVLFGVGNVNGVSAIDGDITITGIGSGSGTISDGIRVQDLSFVRTTGDGVIALTGTATTGGGTGSGIRITDILGSGAVVEAQGTGSVTLTGTGSTDPGIFVNGSTVGSAASAAPLTFIADTITIDSTSTVQTSASGTVTLRQKSPYRQIDLGGDDADYQLGLSDDELDRVTTGNLQIGDANSGTITVSSAITRPTSTNVALVSGDDIDIFGGLIDTGGGTLLLDPAGLFGYADPSFAGTDVIASQVSIDGTLPIYISGTVPDEQYSQLNVNGAVDLTGVMLVLVTSYYYTPTVGDSFTIVNNDGSDPIIGEFLNLPEGFHFTDFLGSGIGGFITYKGGPGNNDVVLTVDNPPVINDQSFNVDENSANGTVVGTVAAYDPDYEDSLTYAITAGNTDGAFAVDPFTGELTVANKAALDFETNPSFSLTVRVTDFFGATTDATVTVNLNDLQTQLTIDNVSLLEGNSGTTTFRFTITSSTAINEPFNVTVSTQDDTATASSGDYDAILGAVVHFDGSSAGEQHFFDVTVHGDAVHEGDERFLVNLTGADSSDVTITAGQGVGTILDDDPALLTASGAKPGDILATATVGQALSVTVGSVTVNFAAAASEFDATINWGDGTTSPGVVTFDTSTQSFLVGGSHTYSTEATYLVRFQVDHPPTGAMDQADAGAAVVLTPGQMQQLDQSDFTFLPPGPGVASVQTDNITAVLVQPTENRTPITLFVAEFNDAPIPVKVVNQAVTDQALVPSNFYDIRVTGATLGTTLTVTLTDRRVAGARLAKLLFFDTASNSLLPVQGSRIAPDSLVIDRRAHTVQVIFDATSVPTVFGLTKTVVAIMVAPAAPQGSAPVAVTTSTASVAPAIALASGQGPSRQASEASAASAIDSGTASAAVVAFRTSSRVSVVVNAAQDSTRSSGSEETTREVRPLNETQARQVLEVLLRVLRSLNDWKKYIPIPMLMSFIPKDLPDTDRLSEKTAEEESGSPKTDPEREDLLDVYFATPPDEGAAASADLEREFTPEDVFVWGAGMLGLLGVSLQPSSPRKTDRKRRHASVAGAAPHGRQIR